MSWNGNQNIVRNQKRDWWVWDSCSLERVTAQILLTSEMDYKNRKKLHKWAFFNRLGLLQQVLMPRPSCMTSLTWGATAAVDRISFFKEVLERWMKLGDIRGIMDHGILASVDKVWCRWPTGIQALTRNLLVDKDRVTDITQSPNQPYEGASQQEARKAGKEGNAQTQALWRIDSVRSEPSGAFLCCG